MSGSVAGLLIHAAAGILGALGRRMKRRGFAAQAAFSTAWRLSWIAGAVPGLLPVRLPGLLAEPAVRLSTQRALHGSCRQAGAAAQGLGIVLPR